MGRLVRACHAAEVRERGGREEEVPFRWVVVVAMVAVVVASVAGW
jgi:hypothetical protein